MPSPTVSDGVVRLLAALAMSLATDLPAAATPLSTPIALFMRPIVSEIVAAETRPETASLAVAENIRRGESGAPFLHRVDRAAGY